MGSEHSDNRKTITELEIYRNEEINITEENKTNQHYCFLKLKLLMK